MSVERSLPAEEPLLAGPIERGAAWALRYPYVTIAVAIALAIASLGWTALRLGYKTKRLDLLSPKSDYNRLWLDYIAEFGEEDDAIVVVEGADREQVVPVLDELAESLARNTRLFRSVLHQVDTSRVEAKGLHYLSPEQLQGLEQFVEGTAPIVAGGWSQLNLAGMISGVQMRLQSAAARGARDVAAAEEAERLSSGLLAILSQPAQYQSPWPDMPQPPAAPGNFGSGHFLVNEGRTGFVLLRLAPGEESFAQGSEAIDELRELIIGVQARNPALKIGLTGLPVLENDEMRSSSADMCWASILSFIGVAVLFVAGFGGWRHALLANLALLIGMAWSFGYVTLVVGHLNILSVSFTVTLIGIGIDYGIYYVARYLELREDYDCREALLAASRGIGPAIATGAITTAVSFFAAAFTSFKGIAELGIIAGGGILLCAVAQLFVLPAALLIMDRSRLGTKLPDALPIHRWLAPILQRPRATVAVTLAATALLALGLGRLWYDHNLLNLQAEGLQSVQLEHRLLTECNQSAWYALSVADSRDELLARQEKLQKLSSIERTEELVSLLPARPELTRPLIERIQQRLSALPERAPAISVDRPQDLIGVLNRCRQLASAGVISPACAARMQQVCDALRQMPAAESYAALSRFQQQMAEELLHRLRRLQCIANPEPPQLADLPPSLVDRFVGKHGRHLLKIYGRGNIWDMDALARFVADVRSVDPKATGNPLQTYEASREMKHSYELAALYALVVILGVLLADFRNLRLASLAAAPLGLGMIQMFGLLGWLNIPLNPANLIALPLILGIGIDYGVHIVHEYAAGTGRYRLSASTAVAVVIDSLTTIVGFGSLMIATHQGLVSLGRVLTLGVTCCLLTSLISLPALLGWLSRNRDEDEAEADVVAFEETRQPLRRAA